MSYTPHRGDFFESGRRRNMDFIQSETPNARLSGVLRWWNDALGYGFILLDDLETEVFIHARAFRRALRPVPNLRVSFELGRNARGQVRAETARPIA